MSEHADGAAEENNDNGGGGSASSPPLVQRVARLTKSLAMNSDAIVLLTRKAESVRQTLNLQSAVTPDNGVTRKYMERLDELSGQVRSIVGTACLVGFSAHAGRKPQGFWALCCAFGSVHTLGGHACLW